MTLQEHINLLEKIYRQFEKIQKDWTEAGDQLELALKEDRCGSNQVKAYNILKSEMRYQLDYWIDMLRIFLETRGICAEGEWVTVSLFGETFYSGPDACYNAKKLRVVTIPEE